MMNNIQLNDKWMSVNDINDFISFRIVILDSKYEG